jgi:hypothetical protein
MLALLPSIGLSTDKEELDKLLSETSDNKFQLDLDKLIRRFVIILYKKEPDEFERDIAAVLFESPKLEAITVAKALPLSIPEEMRKLLADIWVNLDEEDRNLIFQDMSSAHYDMVTILSRCFSFRSLSIDESEINDLAHDLLDVIRKMAVI